MGEPSTNTGGSSLRIAFSGASSTGKSTLIGALAERGVLREYGLRVVAIDERAILRSMGCQDTGCMLPEILREFQLRLMEEKIACEEGQDRYVCEHSFVDMAAYWIVRDVQEKEVAEDEVVRRCRHLAANYDLHVVLPFGAIPFALDGYRSTDMNLHRAVAARSQEFLRRWNLPHVVLLERDLDQRVHEVSILLRHCRRSGCADRSRFR